MCVKRGIRDEFEGACMYTRNTPTDHVWRYPRRCSVNAARDTTSCLLAPALIYSCTVADAREEGSSHQRIPPTSGTHADRRADVHDQRNLWLFKDLLEWGLLTSVTSNSTCPCYPALCGFVFRTVARVWELVEECVGIGKTKKTNFKLMELQPLQYLLHYP